MRKRLTKACYAVSAAAGITVALGLGATGASASVAVHRTHHATPQCQAYNGGGATHCVTWTEPGSLGVGITATSAMPNAPVILTQSDTSNPDQDFLVTELGKVSVYFNGGDNDLGLNSYDNAEYGNDELVLAEFAPGGVPTDLCLANVNDKAVLRSCNGLRWQAFIEATSSVDGMGYGGGAPLGVVVPTTVPPSAVILSCAHVFDNGEHLAMTGAGTDGNQVTWIHPTQNNDQFWEPDVQP